MFATAHRPDLARPRTRAPLIRVADIATPLGVMALTEQDGALVALDFAAKGESDTSPLLRRAAEELAEYFAGKRKIFTLPLRPKGSAFQQCAWAALSAIPFGETRTYGAVARALASGPRAIGQACRSNPLPVFIPCHRVVAVNGLGGFSGAERALDRKRALLAIETK